MEQRLTRARARAARRAAGRRDRRRAGDRPHGGAVGHQRGGRRASAGTSSHWVALADSPEPCGRKLDFLLQEMNREVNTMGSKADGLRVSELIIAAKAELEKMREQVQNVE